uniref:Uncharacterized protein n=1 Tax=Daphnia magna TaxID=35525 RepID=A0A0P5YGX9_9CRUS
MNESRYDQTVCTKLTESKILLIPINFLKFFRRNLPIFYLQSLSTNIDSPSIIKR